MPALEDFKGTLHKVPNIYAVDPDEEVLELIADKKYRYQELQPGGIMYSLYKQLFWYIDYNEGLIPNVKRNVLNTIALFYRDLHVEAILPTLIDFMEKYYRDIKISPSTYIRTRLCLQA